MLTYRLAATLLFALLSAACDSKTPTTPSATAEHVLIIRALDAETKAAVNGLDVTILDGPRAGNTSSTPSDQLPVSLPTGHATLRVAAAGHMPLDVAVDVSGAALLEIAVQRSTTPTPTPSPSPSPGPVSITLSGMVRDSSTGRGISNALVEVLTGADAGRGTRTDGSGAYRMENLRDAARKMKASAVDYAGVSFDVTAGPTVNFDLMPVPYFLFSGTVRDGQGRALAGASVDGNGNISITDANGHYEFRALSNSVGATVRPPTGYEPKPRNMLDRFALTPGQDITIRRIVTVGISPPTTMGLSNGTDFAHASPVTITFDTGEVESPFWDSFSIGSSDYTVVRGRIRDGFAYLEGLTPGTAVVWGSYWGVQSTRYTVQVVRR